MMNAWKYKSGGVKATHDFCKASNFSGKLVVMYAGKIMESVPTPYSKGLLRSMLDIDSEEMKLHPIRCNPPT
jgi:ABC-type dipeptide/oligopeptide/nickel transport system ATPase component